MLQAKHQKSMTPRLTSLRSLKLLVGTGRSLSTVVKNPDVECVEAVRLQCRKLAVGPVPAEGQSLLLHVVRVNMGIVFVQASFFPIIHLR